MVVDTGRNGQTEKDRENKEFLPGVKFPDTIYCSHDMAKCTDGAELIITAAPSPATRTTAKQLFAAR